MRAADDIYFDPSIPTKALQVPRHTGAQGQFARIEPLNLFHAGPGILGEVEDIHLPLAENDPHTNCGMA